MGPGYEKGEALHFKYGKKFKDRKILRAERKFSLVAFYLIKFNEFRSNQKPKPKFELKLKNN